MLERLKALWSAWSAKSSARTSVLEPSERAAKPAAATPMEISFSKISAYRFCPWKYKLVYEDGLRVPPSPAIALGLSIHRALEEFHKEPNRNLDDLVECYNRNWVNEGFQTPQLAAQVYDKGKRMLEIYYASAEAGKSQVIALEKEFMFQAGSRTVRGIVDRIDRLPDGGYELMDYKTHAELWSQDRVDNDLQLTLYALGCKRGLNITPTSLCYVFLAHDKTIHTRRTKEQEEAALKEVEDVAQAIERKDFTPNLAQCPNCDFKNMCAHSTVKGSNGKNK